MTETRATAAAFPPGRYGRRREARRRRWLPVAAALVVAAVSLLVAVTLYQRYGDPPYRGQVTRFHEITDTGLTVDLLITLPPGGRGACLVRARAYDGSEVGRQDITVSADPGSDQVALSRRLATTGRAVYADVMHCRAAP